MTPLLQSRHHHLNKLQALEPPLKQHKRPQEPRSKDQRVMEHLSRRNAGGDTPLLTSCGTNQPYASKRPSNSLCWPSLWPPKRKPGSRGMQNLGGAEAQTELWRRPPIHTRHGLRSSNKLRAHCPGFTLLSHSAARESLYCLAESPQCLGLRRLASEVTTRPAPWRLLYVRVQCLCIASS